MVTGSSIDHAALATRVEHVQTTVQQKTSLSSRVVAGGRALARYGLVVMVAGSVS
jgi:hypothetical protein